MTPPETILQRYGALSAPTLGALMMTLAAFGLSVMNVAIREAAAELDPLQIAFLRNFFAAVFMLPWMIRTGVRRSLATTRLRLHIWRALIGLSAMIAWFTSLSLLPLADAVALNFTVPLFATIGAALVLGEVVRARRWTATVIGFLGVLIILRPGFQELTLAMALPMLAAVFMAISVLLVKTLSRTESAGAVVLYMNLLMTPLSLIPALFVWQWPSWYVLALTLLIGLLGAVSHLVLTRAYALADASAVLPFDYTRLPFVALFAFLIYGEVPDLWVWIGAAVIAVSAFYIARREAQVAAERETSRLAGSAPRGR
jgi:drug/metabolite transporter (DMT)-like permease